MTLAPKGGYLHVGGPGAGHYVKMVHNGIEYGLMQAYAEGFEIMHAPYELDLAAISDCGCRAPSCARGCSSSPRGRSRRTARTSSTSRATSPDSGEGRWTVQEAIDHDVPAPVITLSLLTRFRSRQHDSYAAKVLAALRNEFGGHAVRTE